MLLQRLVICRESNLLRFSIAVLACVCSLLLTPAPAAGDGPASSVPELKALSHYVGTWDVDVTSDVTPYESGESTARWILGGRFLEQSGSIASADGKEVLEVKTLMTFDANENSYRMWTFTSDGESSEWTGTWDEGQRTMTSVRTGGGTTTTTTARFPKDGIEEWSMVLRDSGGEVLMELAGRNQRRKSPATELP